jgi:hypothetical protein
MVGSSCIVLLTICRPPFALHVYIFSVPSFPFCYCFFAMHSLSYFIISCSVIFSQLSTSLSSIMTSNIFFSAYFIDIAVTAIKKSLLHTYDISLHVLGTWDWQSIRRSSTNVTVINASKSVSHSRFVICFYKQGYESNVKNCVKVKWEKEVMFTDRQRTMAEVGCLHIPTQMTRFWQLL